MKNSPCPTDMGSFFHDVVNVVRSDRLFLNNYMLKRIGTICAQHTAVLK